MPTKGVCLAGKTEEGTLSPDSGFRSDSRESHFATRTSPLPTDEKQCSLCCDRSRAVSQLPTCMHSFCQLCLEQLCRSPMHSSCPKCQSNIQLSKIGLSSDVSVAKEPVPVGGLDLLCAQCKTGSVVANCVQCIQLLCNICSASHDTNHVVIKLDAIASGVGVVAQKSDEADQLCVDKKVLCTAGSSAPRRPFRLLDFSTSLRDIFQNTSGGNQDLCQEHSSEVARYYCQNCKQPICVLCSTQGCCTGHEYVLLNDVLKDQNNSMTFAIEQSKAKTNDLLSSVSHLDCISCQLKEQFEESLSNIEKTFCFFSRVLLEHKDEMVMELKNVHTSKLNFLNSARTEVMGILADLKEGEMLLNTLQPLPSATSLIPLKRDILERVERLLEYKPEVDSSSVAFVSNHQAIQTAVRNTFGYVRHNQKTAKSVTRIFAGSEASTPASLKGGDGTLPAFVSSLQSGRKGSFEPGNVFNHSFQGGSTSDVNFQPKTRPACSSVDGYGRSSGAVQSRIPSKAHANHSANQNFIVPQKLPVSASIGSRMMDYLSASGASLRRMPVALSLGNLDVEDDMSKVIVSNVSPALLTRTKMQYHCKFGEYGNDSGQFTEPSGVAVNHLNEILVADANNHRIQVFDRSGNFKSIVGQDGKGEGDLVYPNRLAVNMQTGEIYVTERSPTHQVQVYNQHGRFIRRFGAHILQHPRGITIDKLGRIIVVECKVMRVVIFSAAGTVINRFIVDKRVNFPNGVAVNDTEEIFISDNRRHGVVVFDYQGRFLRTIGGTGLTNYPIGVGINSVGEVVVADNHNNFNVTIFRQDGQLVRAMESRVKHAQCFDIALLSSTSIVMSSKDFRVYVYHYVMPPGLQEAAGQFL